MRRAHVLALAGAALFCLAWLNPARDRIEAGNRLYKQGKYADAMTKYGEALVDDPDSPLLNFNMGDAKYKSGKYAEAIASYERVQGGDDAAWAATRTYNAGNAQYHLGVAAEASKPQDALIAYATALVAYRRVLGINPHDTDAKFNYELVSKKIADLKKRLEQQQKDQQQDKEQQDKQQQDKQQQDKQQQDKQQQDKQQQDKQQQDQQQQQQDQQQAQQQDQQQSSEQQEQPQQPPSDQHDGQQQQQQAGEEKPQEQQPSQQAQGGEPQPQAEQPAQAAESGGESGEASDQMSRHEAAALIDAAKNDELQPEEFVRRQQGAAVAEPAQDW